MTKLHIQGMSCGHCKLAVETALKQVEGVEEASVELSTGTASVGGTAKLDDLITAVSQAGYSAQGSA